jgi:hypothetical protein
MCFSFGGTTAAKVGTAYFSLGGEHGGGGGDIMYFLLAGTTVAKAGTAFFWRGARWQRWGRHFFGGEHGGGGEDGTHFILARRADFVFGSGTAEVIRHRRRDLRVGRLPLHLFGSDRRQTKFKWITCSYRPGRFFTMVVCMAKYVPVRNIIKHW